MWSRSNNKWFVDARVLETSAKGVLVECSGGTLKKLIPPEMVASDLARLDAADLSASAVPRQQAWRVCYDAGVGVRAEAHSFDRQVAGAVVNGFESFIVSEEVPGADGVLWLRLADGRGWLFDSRPGFGVVALREEQGLAAGDAVAMWSNSNKTWFSDGTVTDVTGEGVAVKCNGGRFSKVIPPGQIHEFLRKVGQAGPSSGALAQAPASGQAGSYMYQGIRYASLQDVQSAMACGPSAGGPCAGRAFPGGPSAARQAPQCPPANAGAVQAPPVVVRQAPAVQSAAQCAAHSAQPPPASSPANWVSRPPSTVNLRPDGGAQPVGTIAAGDELIDDDTRALPLANLKLKGFAGLPQDHVI